ncbi:MAG: patatin-like phospholipase family protein [Gemmatimonadales bacterium]
MTRKGAPCRMDGCTCATGGELGIALSGGGARAMAQLGVLKVLDREGVPVSYVAGTSAGAVVGAVYATSETALEAEQRILAHLATTGTGFNTATFDAIAASNARRPAGLFTMLGTLRRASRAGGGLIGGDAMRSSLRGLLGEGTFRDTRIPLATTALDLVSGRRVIFADGPLADAVYASSAIPGLFEPLHVGAHVLVDGGWAEPVPVNTCHHLGAIHVVAVDVAEQRPAHETARGAISTALLADALARRLLEESQLKDADFVLHPQATVKHFADFSDAAGLIAAGERAAEAALPDILQVLERHRSLFVQSAQPQRRESKATCHPITEEA